MQPVVEEGPKSKKRPSTSNLEVTPVSKRHKPLSDSNTPTPLKNTLFAYGFKRLAEPRPLLGHSMSLDEPVTPPPRPKFRHCLSESEADIKRALHRCKSQSLIYRISLVLFYSRTTTGSRKDFGRLWKKMNNHTLQNISIINIMKQLVTLLHNRLLNLRTNSPPLSFPTGNENWMMWE